MRTIGLAIHRNYCDVAIMQEGVLHSTERIQTTPEALMLLAWSTTPGDRAGFVVYDEAWDIAQMLETHLAPVVVLTPNDAGIARVGGTSERATATALARIVATDSIEVESRAAA
ncbi:MAG TPA: hypothetical protein VGX16_00630 [Solirubrobacteraceae bacterium]|jgi:hypothetical protein|nr:hypothetical protein [Solirubrobacteraceae bacterium]